MEKGSDNYQAHSPVHHAQTAMAACITLQELEQTSVKLELGVAMHGIHRSITIDQPQFRTGAHAWEN